MSKKEIGEGVNLGEVGALARALTEAEDDIERIEAQLKVAKERERRLREEDLPAAMAELGLTKIKLETGETIETKLDVYCAITAAQKGVAFEWLDGHGFGGLIKSELSVDFGRDELGLAKEMAKTIAESYGKSASLSQAVAPQTLKAWLKEQLTAGADVPLSLFNARPVTVAKVKRS